VEGVHAEDDAVARVERGRDLRPKNKKNTKKKRKNKKKKRKNKKTKLEDHTVANEEDVS